jgi:hypothetical protein
MELPCASGQQGGSYSTQPPVERPQSGRRLARSYGRCRRPVPRWMGTAPRRPPQPPRRAPPSQPTSTATADLSPGSGGEHRHQLQGGQVGDNRVRRDGRQERRGREPAPDRPPDPDAPVGMLPLSQDSANGTWRAHTHNSRATLGGHRKSSRPGRSLTNRLPVG